MRKIPIHLFRGSSSVTFSLRMTECDVILVAVLAALSGGASFFNSAEQPFSFRVLVSVSAAVGMSSTFVILRSLVPFVMNMSLVELYRLRHPFYVWVIVLLGVIALSRPVVELYASFSLGAVQCSLILLSVALLINFFQTGRLCLKILSSACIGASAGLGVLGFVAMVMLSCIERLMARRLSCCDADFGASVNEEVEEYLLNSSYGLRVKRIMAFCLMAGGMSVFVVCTLINDYGFVSVAHNWVMSIGFGDLAYLVVTGVIPLCIVLRRVGIVSVAMESPKSSDMMVYYVMAPVSALFVIRPELIGVILGVKVVIDAKVMMLATIIQSYVLILSTIVTLVDIRCRGGRYDLPVETSKLRRLTRFLFVVFCLAPYLLIATVVFLFLWYE